MQSDFYPRNSAADSAVQEADWEAMLAGARRYVVFDGKAFQYRDTPHGRCLRDPRVRRCQQGCGRRHRGGCSKNGEAPPNYLSKTLNQLGTLGVLRSERGVRGGYRLGRPAGELYLSMIVEPFLVPEEEHRGIMGYAHCSDDEPCGAGRRRREVREPRTRFSRI